MSIPIRAHPLTRREALPHDTSKFTGKGSPDDPLEEMDDSKSEQVDNKPAVMKTKVTGIRHVSVQSRCKENDMLKRSANSVAPVARNKSIGGKSTIYSRPVVSTNRFHV